MMQECYAIYDVKTRTYWPPFLALNNKDAIRKFDRMVNGDTPMKDFEEDFVLHNVGSMDMEKGRLLSDLEPVHVVKATDVLIEDPVRPKRKRPEENS